MGIIASLIPFIPGLIRTAEAIITAPKSGQTRMGAIVAALHALATPLLVGLAPAEHPTDDALQGAIQAIFTQLQTSGTLNRPTDGGALYLLQGSVTPLQNVVTK